MAASRLKPPLLDQDLDDSDASGSEHFDAEHEARELEALLSYRHTAMQHLSGSSPALDVAPPALDVWLRDSTPFDQALQDAELAAEYKLLAQHSPPGIYVRTSTVSPRVWDGVFFAREGLYERGIFKFRIVLPQFFPNFALPRVFFQSRLFHPLVHDLTGEVHLGLAFPTWDPRRDRVWHVVKYLRHMTLSIKTDGALNQPAAALFVGNRPAFESAVAACVKESEANIYAASSNSIRFRLWTDQFAQGKDAMLHWDSAAVAAQPRPYIIPGLPPYVPPPPPPASARRADGKPASSVSPATQRRLTNSFAADKPPIAGGGSLATSGRRPPLNLQAYVVETLGQALCNSVDIKLTATTCKGFMSKIGNIRKNWKRRWVVLDLESRMLTYYENEQERRKKGEIELESVCKAFQADHQSEMVASNTFLVVTPSRMYQFRAESANGLKVWLVAFTAIAL